MKTKEELNALKNEVEALNKKLAELSGEELTRLLGLTIDHRHLSEDGLTLGLTSYEEVGVEVFGNEQEEMYFLDGSTVLIEENLLDQDKIL